MTTFFRSPAGACLTDARGYPLDSSNPIPVNPAEAGTANFATAQVSVTNVATLIAAARTTRRAIVITNTDTAVTVYLGSATVTSTTGHALPAGGSVSLPIVGAIYGITASATLTVTECEVYD